MVAQAYNPRYLRGREWENRGLRPASAECSLDPISTNGWAWWLMPDIPATWGAQRGGLWARPAQAQARPISKITMQKWQIVECLPSKQETLNSTPSTTQN
jgi:hypothetical protein